MMNPDVFSDTNTDTGSVKGGAIPEKSSQYAEVESIRSAGHAELVHRRLSSRQIQLIALAGTVGAALFVAIGQSLAAGGPANLLMAVTLWVFVVFCVAHCQAEVVSTYPYDGSFITLADRFVSEAYGAMTGWNFFIFQAALICFEINIFNVVISYWYADLNPAILISALVVIYFALNIYNVQWFGEAEFWLALGKLILIISMLLFTLVTMCGGNPQGDAYGFRFWKRPGAFNANGNGGLGRFEGFLTCLINAAFLIAGPEYISMVAGESSNPRKTMPRAFTSIIYRLTAFFILGALAVGIVVPYDDPGLLSGTGPTAAASPYVLGMNRLGISVLPDIVNALIATSIFSSGNAYMYGTSRSLFSLAQRGQAPRIFARINKHGNPWVAVAATSAISCLAYLSVSAGTKKVLGWWISLVTAGQLMNWLIMATTWLRFNAGRKAQNIPRSLLAYQSPLQPYAAWFALIMATVVLAISGYTLFKPGMFKTDAFIFAYGQCFIDIAIYIGWCAWKRNFKWRSVHEMDFTTGLDVLDAYEIEYNALQASKTQHFGNRINRWLFD